jgi:acyl transferase domain-containing protein/thioesterase domain-containing protein/aryl carrier-like protein
MSAENELLDSLKQVTIELRGTRERLRELERRQREPIAIVGMGCRYPGGVRTPEQLWELAAEGRDAISGFPEDRGWSGADGLGGDADGFTLEGGFVDGATEFDAAFFGIGPTEARGLDPQARLLLEVAWETFESAGLDPHRLRGSRTANYVGVMYQDYGDGAAGEDEIALMGGTGGWMVSGGVSYVLDLAGAAVTFDTACSSSLVTIHHACQALRSGDCTLALAGGVTVLSNPEVFTVMNEVQGLAADGRCKPFAAAADGTGWAEGVGLVLLERLSEAERNGHEVLAVIRGSATNQDGATNGITAPNGPSQERVIRQALANAGLGPSEVDAVEAHGTGTTLGDPIEAGALLGTYGQAREPGRPLRLGALKSNIGHTQAAAGVAGVIKMTMAMRHGALPKLLHLDEPSPHVDWERGGIELLAESQPWERNGHPRRAGVSSFGASGTNAHLILEEPPAPAAPAAEAPAPEAPGRVAPLLLSARTEPALREAAERLHAHLRQHPELERAAVARALAARPRFEHRAAVVGAGREQLLEGLAAVAAGEVGEAPGATIARAVDSAFGPVFLFPGQGSQWRSMALGLLDSAPVFAAKIAACEEALEPHVEWSLRSILRREEGAADLERIDVVQPVLFSMMVSLAAMWRAAGVEPAAVLGHSQGELAAAHVAGGLTLEDAAQLVALRSQILDWGSGRGAMALVSVGAEELDARVPIWRRRVSLAGINGPSSIIVSGGTQGIEEVLALCEEQGIWTYKIRAAVGAGHSPAVEEGRPLLMEAAAGIEPRSGEIPFYSCCTAGEIDTAGLDAEYWYRNAREPVLFGPTVNLLLERGARQFVEVSPNPILMMPLGEAFADRLADAGEGSFTPTLRRHQGSLEDFGLALGSLWAHGVELDWEPVLPAATARAPLPTYPFQPQRYWLERGPAGGGDVAMAGQARAEHPLLAAALPQADGEGWTFTGRLSLGTHPWLADSGAMGVAVVPESALLELALRAGAEAGCDLVRELRVEAPLTLPERGAVQLQVTLAGPDGEGHRALAIHSRPEPDEAGGRPWARHATASLAQAPAAEPDAAIAAASAEWPPPGAEPIDLSRVYDDLAAAGLDYGPAFQGLLAAWRRGDEVLAEVALSEEDAASAAAYGLHPALLGAVLQAAAVPLPGAEAGEGTAPLLPAAFADVRLRAPGQRRLRATLSGLGGERPAVRLADDSGAPVAEIGALELRALAAERLAANAGVEDSLLACEWSPLELAEAPGEPLLVGLGAAALAGELDGATALPDLEALAAHETLPSTVAFVLPEPGGDTVAAAHANAAAVLAAAQAWLADERWAGSRLVFLSAGALAAAPGDGVPDLAAAPVWGLARSAQSEHPGRFGLLDHDGDPASLARLAAALELAAPQLALRRGEALRPRIRRAAPEPAPAPAIDPEGTLLVTGDGSGPAGLAARHLIATHGLRHVAVVVGEGEEEAAESLRAELGGLGAEATLHPAAAGDRAAIAAAIAAIDPAHPLTAVLHAAGPRRDGLFAAIAPADLEAVLAPKLDAAWHLHELTAELDLGAFVLFSSVAAGLGRAGQAGYAAANAFLDALAARRAAAGLPATAIGWGLWEQTLREADATLDEEGMALVGRSGFAPLSDEEGLGLLDAALGDRRPALLAARLHPPALRSQARAGTLSPLLSELVRLPARRAGASAEKSIVDRVRELPKEQREEAVLGFLRDNIAEAVGAGSGAEVDPDTPLLELGFDSLTALQYRNRLQTMTGLRLTIGAVLDHPTPRALSRYLLEQLDVPAGSEPAAAAEGGGLLAPLLAHAAERGEAGELFGAVATMARYRPAFASPEESGVEPVAVRLAEGPAEPALVFVPSLMPFSGPHEYRRLATAFGSAHEALSLRWPGFGAGERLPASVEAALGQQLAALEGGPSATPLVLLAHSSGGPFAYALAQRLERLGRPAAGLVMLDSYHPSQIAAAATGGAEGLAALGAGVFSAAMELGDGAEVDLGELVDDARLTATARYMELMAELELEPLAAPVLLATASEPLGEVDPDSDGWRPRWELPHELLEVPGNHLSMMDAQAESTAEAISRWIDTVLGAARATQAKQGDEDPR